MNVILTSLIKSERFIRELLWSCGKNKWPAFLFWSEQKSFWGIQESLARSQYYAQNQTNLGLSRSKNSK